MIVENNHPWQQDKIVRHTQLMMSSFERLTGRTLINTADDTDIAKALFEADFVLDISGNKKHLSPNLSPQQERGSKPHFPAPGRGVGGLGFQL